MKGAIQLGLLLGVWLTMTAGWAAGADLSGRYVDESGEMLTLSLQEASDGVITGTMSEPGTTIPIKARRQGTGFAGTVGPAGGQVLPMTAVVDGDRLILQIGVAAASERVVFKRAGSASSAAPAHTASKRNVTINGKRLSDQELQNAEQKYRIRIPDADYWYDRVLGAWGVRRGPTMGFVAPNLELGGPLAADASGRGSNIFVNGRELHSYDVLALQQITGPILPGRYFITAQGLAGYEGGLPLWNLAAMAAQAQGGGGSNTWQSRITGASGFSDGTTGAVFLPNGGIVSTGN